MLNPHSSRPVWSFSSLSKTKGQLRPPTTLGDGIEGALISIISTREESRSKEHPRDLLQTKQRLLLKWNRRLLSFTQTPCERLILSPSGILMANERQIWIRIPSQRKAGDPTGQILTPSSCSCFQQSLSGQKDFLTSLSGPVPYPILGELRYYCPGLMCAIHHPTQNVGVRVPDPKERWSHS